MRRVSPYVGGFIMGVLFASSVFVGLLLYDAKTQPEFRLVCERVDSDSSGLTLKVATAKNLDEGTSFAIDYGDGTSDGDGLGGRRADPTHTYRTRGSYEIHAQLHLPSNAIERYEHTCKV